MLEAIALHYKKTHVMFILLMMIAYKVSLFFHEIGKNKWNSQFQAVNMENLHHVI